MNGYYELIIKALKEQGFFRIEGGKGSHEKWTNGRHIAIVPFSTKSRFTANQILKDAGSKQRF
jgi:predicted RNA binding protein YcfA (HicA-like mRNA interferase family)